MTPSPRLEERAKALDPCIPAAWPAYSIAWRFGASRYVIDVVNPDSRSRGVASAFLDGAPVDPGAIPLSDDAARHHLDITLGEGVAGAVHG